MAGPSDQQAQGGLTRRELIGRLAAAGFSAPVIASIVAREGLAQEATPAASPAASPVAKMPFEELAPEEKLAAWGKDPRMIAFTTTNFGTPLELVEGLIVPNELFYIRSHGPTPQIDPAAWRLSVGGLVEQEIELSLADLQAMPQRTITAFLECAGDSRSRFEPKTSGTQWGNNAVGNAEWTGVSVSEVLNQAGVQEGAIDVVSQGGDFADYQRGMPLGEAMDPDTMLVWEMNGEPLPIPNGGPVRLFQPSWVGSASTKWTIGLTVIDHQFDGHFNTESYVIIDERGAVRRPAREMPIKSVITTPLPLAELSAGPQTITGFAWSGFAGITKVEASVDGGANWAEATIAEEAGPLSWVRFEYLWDAQPGRYQLQSRAYDAIGMIQPFTIPWNAKGYQMHAIYEVDVTVA